MILVEARPELSLPQRSVVEVIHDQTHVKVILLLEERRVGLLLLGPHSNSRERLILKPRRRRSDIAARDKVREQGGHHNVDGQSISISILTSTSLMLVLDSGEQGSKLFPGKLESKVIPKVNELPIFIVIIERRAVSMSFNRSSMNWMAVGCVAVGDVGDAVGGVDDGTTLRAATR